MNRGEATLFDVSIERVLKNSAQAVYILPDPRNHDKYKILNLNGAWRSLVAHLLWEQGVGGSNPLAPTKFSIMMFFLAGVVNSPCDMRVNSLHESTWIIVF